MILVTGATGLVGSHLTMALLEKHLTIRAMYRSDSSLKEVKKLFRWYGKESGFDRIQWVQADITDITTLDAAFENITEVFHCAALVSFDPKEEDAIRKTNIEGTANMVNFCLEYRVNKLTHISSIAALGDSGENELVISEKSEWNPQLQHSDYAISKYGAEMEVWRGKEEGLNILIVNPGVILGPGTTGSSTDLLLSGIEKRMPFYTKGSTGFISVHDVVRCILFLSEHPDTEGRYCLVAEHVDYQSLLSSAALGLGVNPPSLYAAPWLTALGWRIDWILSNFFQQKRTLSKMLAKSLHEKRRFSNEKLRAIYPEKFETIQDCLEESVRFYRRH